jgi:hypothetical protein
MTYNAERFMAATIIWLILQNIHDSPLGSVTSLLAATLYQGNHDRNHKKSLKLEDT